MPETFTFDIDTKRLDAKIIEFAAFTGKTVRDVGQTVIKGLVRDVINITPPATGKANKNAQRTGEAAILRDLNLMGFEPVTIKGYREINTVFGRKIDPPVRVKTKLNPRFADPQAIHRARLASKHGGRPTRGGRQAWYVDRTKFNALRRKLFAEVGKLSAGWVPAADRLGVSVPSWIRRHGAGNGGTIEISYEKGIRVRAVNHFPDTAGKEARDTQRRIEAAKQYATNSLQRQLNFLLKRGWRKS